MDSISQNLKQGETPLVGDINDAKIALQKWRQGMLCLGLGIPKL